MSRFNPPAKFPLKRKSGEIDENSSAYPNKKPATSAPFSAESGGSCWTVQWRNFQGKKHKTWEGDGVLLLQGFDYSLFDTDAKSLGTGKHLLPRMLEEGDEINIGGKDVLIDLRLPLDDFRTARCFSKTASSTFANLEKQTTTAAKTFKFQKPFAPLQPSSTNKNTKLTPQLQAVSGRQYPSAAQEERVDVTDFFEDDGKYVGDRYKVRPGSELDPKIEKLWSANWRKPTAKKNKTWDGDGMIHQQGSVVRFLTEDGKKVLGTKTVDTVLSIGSKIFMNDKEIEIDSKLPLSHLQGQEVASTPVEAAPMATNFSSTAQKFKFKPPAMTKRPEIQEAPPKPKEIGPLHDPMADGAIVMRTPQVATQLRYNPKNRPLVPVVVDPLLGKKLRPHQIQGVKFLYECVMGMSKHEGQGCILADEMGLGKTLQTIALVWTLLKQNPYGGNGPVIGKAMIVCPVSLVENWKKEFHKWIGRDRIGVFTGNVDKTAIKQFINSRIHQVLVIGYERLRGVIQELAYCNPPIGLIVCDEGHRLKSAGSKTTKMFEALRTARRVILSGTPIQNDLGEFHAMADFCNPGLLDEYATFKRVYEAPILASRAPDCTSKTRELGSARAEQLQMIAKSFVLRREATILSNYLPPKFEYVVFVRPTDLQLSMLTKILNPETLGTLLSSTAKSLALIQTLSKLCNSPCLLKNKDGDSGESAIGAAIKLIPSKATPEDPSLSGKLTALANILQYLKQKTDEKCVVVSHYTSTLDVVERFCTKKRYSLFRLDGQTPPATRQEYVDKFNKATQNERFLFLLSAKAGGVGLNLIGASRLILIDGDWNPSHDLQAMARIHRDGQKRPVFIYRLLTAGTIDEKIFQRQITKLGLSDAMMGNNTNAGKSKTDSFTSKELRDLFNVYPHAACHTHELLSCPCERSEHPISEEEGEEEESLKPRRKFVQEDSSDSDEDDPRNFVLATQVDMNKYSKSEMQRKKDGLASLAEWTHINCMRSNATGIIQDDILGALVHPAKRTVIDVDLDEPSFEDAEQPTEELEISVKDVPGGTVTFVFERVSKTDL